MKAVSEDTLNIRWYVLENILNIRVDTLNIRLVSEDTLNMRAVSEDTH
jgi:hypothetical protein